MNFSKRLKSLRLENNWTQKDLAEKLNISDRSIGYYENGNRFPKDEDLLVKLCDIFNVSMDYLMGLSNVRNPSKDTRDYVPETLAAHFDGDEFSKEDLEDIENFIEFVKQRKKGKG